MFCKYCGKEISDDAKFCSSCGKTLNDIILNEKNDHIVASKSHGLSITSFILGILSIITFFVFYISLPCALLATIIGKSSIKQKLNGRNYAKLGIKLGTIGAIICAVFTIIMVTIFIFWNSKFF